MEQSPKPQPKGPILLVVALPGELGALRVRASEVERAQGLVFLAPHGCSDPAWVAVVAGIGKVRGAQAAALGIRAFGARGVLSFGVCGGLSPRHKIGQLVHCERAVQADSAVREDREYRPDPAWIETWRRLAPGPTGWFLTADRPALSPWRRLRLARAFGGWPVAEMETAAIAAVAVSAGLPWAALRAVSDTLGFSRSVRFRHNYSEQAGRAAASVEALVATL
jgi:nucleoside phosphorylase